VQRAGDDNLLGIKVEPGKQPLVSRTLNRCGNVTDLSFSLRVINRFSTATIGNELNDALRRVLQRDPKVLVLFRQFDHDANHGASSVERSKQPLDDTGSALATIP
jgi:hypothetical protein